jgi:hypothetical protein
MHREKNRQQQFFPQKKGHWRRHERSTYPFFSNCRLKNKMTSAARTSRSATGFRRGVRQVATTLRETASGSTKPQHFISRSGMQGLIGCCSGSLRDPTFICLNAN